MRITFLFATSVNMTSHVNFVNYVLLVCVSSEQQMAAIIITNVFCKSENNYYTILHSACTCVVL